MPEFEGRSHGAMRAVVVQNSHSCPTSGCIGNELIFSMRETGFEVFLNRLSSGANVPGTIGLLSTHEECNCLPILWSLPSPKALR